MTTTYLPTQNTVNTHDSDTRPPREQRRRTRVTRPFVTSLRALQQLTPLETSALSEHVMSHIEVPRDLPR